MSDGSRALSVKGYARLGGLGYLTIIVTGIFAEFFVRSSLIVPEDAAATASNIVGSELLYRSGLAAEFLMLIADVAVALALFVVFESVSRSLALLAAFFRLVHAAVVAGNLLNVYVPLLLLSRTSDSGSAFSTAQVHVLVELFLKAHSYGYAIGLVFFGVHCLILGYLVFTSGFAPSCSAFSWQLPAPAIGSMVWGGHCCRDTATSRRYLPSSCSHRRSSESCRLACGLW